VKPLFYSDLYIIKPITNDEWECVFEVYKRCEDFLSLGPVPKASREMVDADIRHSVEEKGTYCGIWNDKNIMVGIIDFIPEISKGIAFLLC
jgi:hypothetical protein